MVSHQQIFIDAKKMIRLHPDWEDMEVAEAIGLPERILAPGCRELETIAQARKDVTAESGTRTFFGGGYGDLSKL